MNFSHFYFKTITKSELFATFCNFKLELELEDFNGIFEFPNSNKERETAHRELLFHLLSSTSILELVANHMQANGGVVSITCSKSNCGRVFIVYTDPSHPL